MKSPFKFLDPYTRKDKNVFFGRDKEIEELYQMVFKTPLLLVYGTSGTGKTSLVQCGLASKFDGPEWYPFFIRRQNDINLSIGQALAPALGENKHESLKKSVQFIHDSYFRPVYLIFDQFEEIFISGTQEERTEFIAQIKELLDAHIPVKVILIMREDYLGQLYPFEREIPFLLDFRFRVEPMRSQAVEDVISSTFHAYKVKIEEPKQDHLDSMIANLSDEKTGIALPYLQVYMDTIYRESFHNEYPNEVPEGEFPPITVKHGDIEKVGNITNVLDRFLEQQTKVINEKLKSENPDYKGTELGALLDAFVTEDGTKRQIPYIREAGNIAFSSTEMEKLPSIPITVMNQVITGLENSRLLRVEEDAIELAHDSLAALIDEKRSDEQRSLNKVKKRLSNAFQEFTATNGQVTLTKKQMLSFEEYIPQLNLDREMIAFIHSSEKAIAKKEQEAVEMQRKEIEAEEKTQRAELLAAKNRAEKAKLEAEKSAIKDRRNIRILQLVLLGAIASIAGLGFWGAVQKNKVVINEKVMAERERQIAIQEAQLSDQQKNVAIFQKDSINILKDSIQQIFDRLTPHVDKADALIRGEVNSTNQTRALSLLETAIYIRGVMDGDPDEKIRKFATNAFVYPDNFYSTKTRDAWERNIRSKRDSVFNMNSHIEVFAFIRSPKTENIYLEWYHESDPENAIQSDSGDVKFNIGKGYRWSKPLKSAAKKLGNYTVKFLNGEKDVVGETHFKIE